MPTGETRPPARTLLEHLIRQRRQTFEEFAEYADRFARQHQEAGTISVRHLQRLAAGRRRPGEQLGAVRPATARLLERIFDVDVAELLAPPSRTSDEPTHLRVAVAIVLKSSHILVVRRRKDPRESLLWQFPAGIIKPGRSLLEVAQQETMKETGVHCEPIRHLGGRLHPLTRVQCEYIQCRHIIGEPFNKDATENDDALWVEVGQLETVVPRTQIFPAAYQVINRLRSSAGAP